MRAVWVLGVAVGGVAAVALGGCAGILGDFTVSDGEGPDASSSPDGSVPGPDGQSPIDAGSDHATRDAAPPGPAPQLSAGSPTLDFGKVTAHQSVAPGTIDVTNVGMVTTGALTTSITGASYTVMNDGCKGATLAPNAVCHVQIALDDSTPGTPMGTFTIVDSSTDTLAVPLTATVLTPGALAISPQSQDFKSWVLNAMSAAQVFTVTNNGQSPSGMLTASVMPLNNTMASEFPVTDGCSGKTLPPNGTCTISVLLQPATRGAKAASLLVTGNPGGTATASLTGTGLAPTALSISPATYDFMTAKVGAPGPTQTFTVSNMGDVPSAALTTGITLGSGTANGELAITADTCKGATLGATPCSITVQFAPATYGAKAGSLDINGGSPSATLTGTGEDFVALTVTKSGIGSGTVSDGTGMITCGSTCNASYARTTSNPVVTLTAAPDPTSTFAGWTGGGCSGTAPCAVTLSAATTAVDAQFTCSQCGGVCVDLKNDAANCGSCGHGCQGGTCSNGSCNPVTFYSVAVGAQPTGIAVDPSWVYWADSVSGSYGKVQVCANTTGTCGSAVDLIASTPTATSGLPSTPALSVAGGQVVATGQGLGDGMTNAGGRMESCPAVTTTPTTCTPTLEEASGSGLGPFFTRVVTDGTNIAARDFLRIFWTKVGAATQNYYTLPTPYAAQYGSNNNPVGVTLGVTSGATYIYWTVSENNGSAGSDSHKVFRCQIGGGAFPCSTTTTPGTPQLVFDGSTVYKNPGPIVFDAVAQKLYWLDQGSTPNPPPSATDGKLLSCSVSVLPCTPTTLAANLSNPVDLAQDASTIYFGTYGGGVGTVQECAKTGCNGTPTLLANNEAVQFMAVDTAATGSVWWTTYAGVRRLAKP